MKPKPCEWCGSEDVTVLSFRATITTVKQHFVRCRDCSHESNCHPTEEAAVLKWNKHSKKADNSSATDILKHRPKLS